MGRPKKNLVEELVESEAAEAAVAEAEEAPKSSKADLVDVLKDRVEILTAKVKDYEKLAARLDGLGEDLGAFAVVLGRIYGDPLKGELSRIALRHKGDK